MTVLTKDIIIIKRKIREVLSDLYQDGVEQDSVIFALREMVQEETFDYKEIYGVEI